MAATEKCPYTRVWFWEIDEGRRIVVDGIEFTGHLTEKQAIKLARRAMPQMAEFSVEVTLCVR